MKKSFLTILATVTIATAYAQYSYQVVNAQQVRKDLGVVASDNYGNVIITGTFNTTLTLGSFTLQNNNGYDQAFVAKKSPDGSFTWAKLLAPLSVPGGASYAHIYDVCTDAGGNVYITGNFLGKINFASNITLTSLKNGADFTWDIFTEKISSAGVVTWAKSAGSGNDGCNAAESGRSVVTDNAGNVYMAGRIVSKVFKNTTACNDLTQGGPTCTSATSKSITCPYLVKYGPSGNLIWEKRFLNNGALATTSCWYNHPEASYIETDGIDIYVCGYFYGTVDFGTGSLSTGSESTGNVFLLRLNGSGSTEWARSVTGGSNNTYAVGSGLLVNGNDIYISGIYSGNISFGTCTLAAYSPPAFFAKYSVSGACQWAVAPGGISYGAVGLSNGNIAMLRRGRFYSILEISPSDGSLIDSTVTPLADTATGSAGGYPFITRLPDGFIFSQMTTGTYHFGDLTITTSVPFNSGWGDMTLVKYTEPAPLARTNKNLMEQPGAPALYPNPVASQLTIRNENNRILGTVCVYDVSGKMILKKFVDSRQTTIDVRNLSMGVYYLRSDQLQSPLKFIKQ